MEKVTFRQRFREILNLVAFFIWLPLIATTMAICTSEYSTKAKVILVVISGMYTIIWITMFVKASLKKDKQKKQLNEKRLLEAEERYKCYIDLVNVQVQKTLEKFG